MDLLIPLMPVVGGLALLLTVLMVRSENLEHPKGKTLLAGALACAERLYYYPHA